MNDDGDHDFGLRCAVAGNVAVEQVDVRNNQGFVFSGGGAADAAAQRDAGAGGQPLEGADDKGLVLQEIKAGPVEARQALENQGGRVGGIGDAVRLAAKERGEFLEDVGGRGRSVQVIWLSVFRSWV